MDEERHSVAITNLLFSGGYNESSIWPELKRGRGRHRVAPMILKYVSVSY